MPVHHWYVAIIGLITSYYKFPIDTVLSESAINIG